MKKFFMQVSLAKQCSHFIPPEITRKPLVLDVNIDQNWLNNPHSNIQVFFVKIEIFLAIVNFFTTN